MRWHHFQFGGIEVCLPGDGPDKAAQASIETGNCVVLIAPCIGDNFAAIVFDQGAAVWGCVADSPEQANSQAAEAIREVYPNSHFSGDVV